MSATPPATDVRTALLARCDALSLRALTGHGTESKRVRRAIQGARDLIAAAPAPRPDQAPVGWLRARLGELEVQRALLDRLPDDEDGWSLGGLRTVMNEVEAAIAQELAAEARARSWSARCWRSLRALFQRER